MTLTPCFASRHTTYEYACFGFAAVAGLLFLVWISALPGRLYYRPFRTDQPVAGMGRQQHDAWRGNYIILTAGFHSGWGVSIPMVGAILFVLSARWSAFASSAWKY